MSNVLVKNPMIVTGGGAKLTDLNATENEHTYTPEGSGYDGYNSVYVNVPIYTKSISENGTYYASSDSCAGYSEVSVNVAPNLAGSWGNVNMYMPAEGNSYYTLLNLNTETIRSECRRIEMAAAKNRTNFTSITIPDSIESIGSYAFQNCPNLQSVDFGACVIQNGQFGTHIFQGCSNLTNVYMDKCTIPKISSSMFQACSALDTIVLPDNITGIEDWSFNSCSYLSYVRIPNSVTSIGWNAFSGCSNLSSLTYTGTMAEWGNITFGTDWCDTSVLTTIHCSNGDITL